MFNKKDPLVQSVVSVLRKSAEEQTKAEQENLNEGTVVNANFDQDSKDKRKVKKFSKSLTGKKMSDDEAEEAVKPLPARKAARKKDGNTLADIQEEIRDNLVEKLANIYEESGEEALDSAIESLTEEQVEILGFNDAGTLDEGRAAGPQPSVRGVPAQSNNPRAPGYRPPQTMRTRNLAPTVNGPVAASMGRDLAAKGQAMSALRSTINSNQTAATTSAKPAAASPTTAKPAAKNISSTATKPTAPAARPMGSPMQQSPGEITRQALGGQPFNSVKPVNRNNPSVRPITRQRPVSNRAAPMTTAAQDTMTNLMRESLESFVRNKFLKD